LFNPWAACCVLVILVIMIVELAGFLGFCQIKFNPVSAVTLITAVGIGSIFNHNILQSLNMADIIKVWNSQYTWCFPFLQHWEREMSEWPLPLIKFSFRSSTAPFPHCLGY
jgi:hypothetical protein